jgi:N6-L-threonylcarbamoyladenine synthase
MPCFLAGVAAAEFAAATDNLPLYRISHQAGHIMAALNSACRNGGADRDLLMKDRFLAFHVSGGTTDVLLCEPDDTLIFRITQIGGTRDINGGQAIDRTGVKMGLHFPCGAEMDQAALAFSGKIARTKLSVDGTWCNLSGLENMAIKLYRDTNDKALVAAFVFDYIGRAISVMIDAYKSEYGDGKIICAGGVMCNRIIKEMLSSKYDVAFAEPALSADNAVGCAVLTLRAYKSENNCD